MKLPFNIDLEYIAKAIVGIASPVVGVVTSFQEQRLSDGRRVFGLI